MSKVQLLDLIAQRVNTPSYDLHAPTPLYEVLRSTHRSSCKLDASDIQYLLKMTFH